MTDVIKVNVHETETVKVKVFEGGPGPTGPQGEPGTDGTDSMVPGPAGERGPAGRDGVDGRDSIVPGPQGPAGRDGVDGKDGADSTVPGPQGPAGRDGRDGVDGAEGPRGPAGAASTVPGPAGERGPIGPASTVAGPAGPGVPSGGATGQVLAKTSATNYATGWVTPAAGGSATPAVTFATGSAITNYSYSPSDFHPVRYSIGPATNVGGGVWNVGQSTWYAPITGTYLLVGSIRWPDNTPALAYSTGIHTGAADGPHGLWTFSASPTTRPMTQYTRILRVTAGTGLMQYLYQGSPSGPLTLIASGQGCGWSATLLSAG